MRSLKLTVAYDGGRYCGWQVQARGATIQQTLERAWTKVTGERIRLTASGRTDAGVHALAQAVSLETSNQLPCDVLVRALNASLPDDIAVLGAAPAPRGFHAIRDAVGKRYRYLLHDGPLRDVFASGHAWWVFQRLDTDAMHRAAQSLRGRHDFCSFQSAGSERATTVRTVTDIFVERRPLDGAADPTTSGGRIVLEIAADGFLYNMVRAIVGTLVEVGRGAKGEEWPAAVLAAKNRRAAGMTAPPQGLILVSVEYPSPPAVAGDETAC